MKTFVVVFEFLDCRVDVPADAIVGVYPTLEVAQEGAVEILIENELGPFDGKWDITPVSDSNKFKRHTAIVDDLTAILQIVEVGSE